jgi:hypothetical protein
MDMAMHEQLFSWLLASASARTLRALKLGTECVGPSMVTLMQTAVDLDLRLYAWKRVFPTDLTLGIGITSATLLIPYDWSLFHICTYLERIAGPFLVVLHLRLHTYDASATYYEFAKAKHWEFFTWSAARTRMDWGIPQNPDVWQPLNFPENRFPNLQRLEISFPESIPDVWNVRELRETFPDFVSRGIIHFTGTHTMHEGQEDSLWTNDINLFE